MRNILLVSLLLLTACSTTVPVVAKFPEAPNTLMEKCPPLDTIDKPTVLLSELVYTITHNYMKYHECANLVEGWQEWHTDQKKIFDGISK
jgi:hypothetical protein